MKRIALFITAVCAVGLMATTASAQHPQHYAHHHYHHLGHAKKVYYGGYYNYPSYSVGYGYGYPGCVTPIYTPYYPAYRQYGYGGYRPPYYGGSFYFGVRF